ncbi:hypothetical protein [Endozoicomonas sp. Mp262]|uniref:hypothetical protein n=1 Tax=Endozoicomonas sp. Mp262 TaxID=2919499 RepID=UPI0021D92A63
MPYTHFQYLAYQTPTFGRDNVNNLWRSSLAAGELCDAVNDIPVPDNLGLSDDAKKRLRRLAAVVNEAHDSLVGDQNTTLKVFMAPEFYFRPESGANSYSYAQSERGKILVALGLMFKNAKFDHWLIVAGTIIANIPKLPRPALPPYHYFYNTAIVIKGGTNCRLTAIEKNQPSGIDGVPVTGGISNPNVAGGNYTNHYSTWNERKQRMFRQDGVQMGLDICLDHAGPVAFNVGGIIYPQDTLRMAKRVSNESINQPPLPAPLPDISLHLLTAGGMPIVTQSVAAKNNGYILRTDGHPGMATHIELKRINNYTTPAGNTTPYNMATGNPQLPIAVGGSTSNFPNCPTANLTNVLPVGTVPLTGKMKIPIDAQYNPTNMTQAIVMFPVTALP